MHTESRSDVLPEPWENCRKFGYWPTAPKFGPEILTKIQKDKIEIFQAEPVALATPPPPPLRPGPRVWICAGVVGDSQQQSGGKQRGEVAKPEQTRKAPTEAGAV